MVRIIEFEDRFSADFRNLNEAWLIRYGLMETHDREIIDDPVGTVISPGGFIFLAVADDKVVGTAGLMKEGSDEFELVKMAVDPEHQGRGIAKLLIERCIHQAKSSGASRLYLYSNSQLQPAIRLYSQFGFKHIPADQSPFVTADVKMEIRF